MNLLQLLNDYFAKNIDLNDVTPDDAHWIFHYQNPFEFLDKNGGDLIDREVRNRC